jgi:ribosomal subunit interface protein
LPLSPARPKAEVVEVSLARTMNIAIHAQGVAVDDQLRAYIEYRMFSAISRFGRRCLRVGVHLEESEATQAGTRYRCAVALQLNPLGRVRVRATADRLYAAVDESAERLSRRVERRLGAGSSTRGTRR